MQKELNCIQQHYMYYFFLFSCASRFVSPNCFQPPHHELFLPWLLPNKHVQENITSPDSISVQPANKQSTQTQRCWNALLQLQHPSAYLPTQLLARTCQPCLPPLALLLESVVLVVFPPSRQCPEKKTRGSRSTNGFLLARMVFATAIRVLSKTYRTTRKVISSLVPMEPYSTPSPSRFAFCLHNRISLKSTAFQNASSLVDGFFLGYFQNKYRKISRASTQLHVQKECPHFSMADPYPKLSLVDKGPILQVCNLSLRDLKKSVNSAQPSSHQLKEMIGKLKNWPDFFHYCSFSVRQLIFWFSFCLCLARLVLLLWHFYWSRWCWWFFLHLVNVLKKNKRFTINK